MQTLLRQPVYKESKKEGEEMPLIPDDIDLSKKAQCRGKKDKKPKKLTKTQINKKADTEWSAMVKILAGGRCEICGTTENLNSHHVFGRVNHSVRWDVNNGVCLCVGHHKFKHDFSAHNTPTLFTEWVILKRGKEWHDLLTLRARKILK